MNRNIRRRLQPPGIVAGLLLAAQAHAAEPPRLDPALAASPPRVAGASFQLLPRVDAAGNNAVLSVRFAGEPPKSTVPGIPPRTLPIQGGPGPTLLRDDGKYPDTKAADGIFAAVVTLNAAQLDEERARRITQGRQVSKVPRFEDRTLLEWVPFKPQPRLVLRPGIEQLIEDFRGFYILADASRSLLVRDPAVVEDPARTYEPCTGAGTQMGPWTFGRLVTEMANQPATGIDPAALAEHWMNQWKLSLNINGFTPLPRSIGADRFLNLWPRLPDGRLDLARAPFRLLAIVNRQDLRTSTFYGGGDAGEARLVFGAVHCAAPTPGMTQQVLPFTVIFEYGVPKSGCMAVRDWARQWQNLGTMVLGSAPYNAALQSLTDQFTLRGLSPAKPNGSAINQVRTNEFVLADFITDTFWQLRESKLVASGPSAGLLEHGTLAQTPDSWFHLMGGAVVRDFINAHTGSILADAHVVPLEYPVGSPFRGATADPGAGRIWGASGVANPEARRKFSLAACDACHTTETGTGFLHIKPRAIGATSQLSSFLTGAGMPMSTPVSGEMRTYHDLLDRAQRLDMTANMSCRGPRDLAVEDLFLRTRGPFASH